MLFMDVFCGAGGFTEGFKMAGWKHVVGIEWDKYAAATYSANNHGDVIVKDAREVKMDDLQPYLKKHGVVGRKKLDAIVASPPCTSFSSAGPQKEGDERDMLYKEVLRLADLLKPKLIVMENVIGMKTKRNANGVSFADVVVAELRGIGYHCEYRMLSALQFGVPQVRRRLIFVASKNPKLIRFPEVPEVKATDVPVGPFLDRPEAIPPGYWMDQRQVKMFERRAYARFVDFERACNTIRATYYKSNGEHALVRYPDGRMRLLTEKEVAQIQGFPNSFVFIGSKTQVYKQIGNAVAPPMAKGIAEALLQ